MQDDDLHDPPNLFDENNLDCILSGSVDRDDLQSKRQDRPRVDVGCYFYRQSSFGLKGKRSSDYYNTDHSSSCQCGYDYKEPLSSCGKVSPTRHTSWVPDHRYSVPGTLWSCEYVCRWGACASPTPYMITPAPTSGTMLHDYLGRNVDCNRLEVVKGIASALDYLHSKNIVHGDLKAANILVSDDGIPLLSDFGRSSLSSFEFSGSAEEIGTIRYMAPELVLYEEKPTAASDVYSWGSVCYEILTNITPFASATSYADIVLAFYGKELPYAEALPLVKGNTRDLVIWNLMVSCWAYDPGSRANMKAVLSSLQKHVRASKGNRARL